MTESFILRPDNRVIETAIEHIRSLHTGKEWEVTVKPYKKNKTAQQRKYYHKLLQIISEYTGDTIDHLKTRMCFTLGFVDEVQLKDGTKVLQRLSTESLGVKRYSTMIESAQMACMSMGLKYPQPNYYGYEI